MFSPSLLFLLLLVGSSAAHVIFVKNPDGTFTEEAVDKDGIPMVKHDNDGRVRKTTCNDDSLPADFASAPSRNGNIARHPGDDEGVALVQEFAGNEMVNISGQLRYSSLPVVEKAMMKDLFRLIAKNEDYMAFLNNPKLKDLYTMIQKAIHGPENQEVLQRQIWNKIRVIEAYYKKFFKPLNNIETKKEALRLLIHLKEASEDHQLTVEDTVKLNDNLKTLAFLIEDEAFNQWMAKLEKTLKPAPSNHKTPHHVRKNAVTDSPSTHTEKKVESEGYPDEDVSPGKPRFQSMSNDNNGTRHSKNGFAGYPVDDESPGKPRYVDSDEIESKVDEPVWDEVLPTHSSNNGIYNSFINDVYQTKPKKATTRHTTVSPHIDGPTKSSERTTRYGFSTTSPTLSDIITSTVGYRTTGKLLPASGSTAVTGLDIVTPAPLSNSTGKPESFIEQEVLHRVADPGAGY